eukprot:m.105572 g.105572  ORF g.105572 m.105572 type:complete len:577 (-) comp27660_c0_seq1:85-1815(-)
MPLLKTSLLILMLFSVESLAKKSKQEKAAEKRKNEKCETCHKITTAFYEGYENTDTIEFTGESKGWSMDNEKFLGKYKMGEARLVEILENVCAKKDESCHDLLGNLEEDIEEWFGERENEDHDFNGLDEHLCVRKAKLCCTPNAFGPTCSKCKGVIKTKTENVFAPCSGHGACNGDGTRGGTGRCKCEAGWGSKSCNKCLDNHFSFHNEVTEEDECRECDVACSGCTRQGAQGCKACAKGFEESADSAVLGCVDVNECSKLGSTLCSDTGTFCHNTRGSFSCEECSDACADPGDTTQPWCTGAAAENCKACKAGYKELEGGGCEDVNECDNNEHDCKQGRYCNNKPGSFECKDCHSSCSTDGCTSGSASDCVSCKAGYGGKPCKDIDECDEFVCVGAEDCVNTDGAYTCSCSSPNVVDEATRLCERPKYLRDLSNQTEIELNNSKDGFEKLNRNAFVTHKSSVYVGASPTSHMKQVSVVFEQDAFAHTVEVPSVSYVQAKKPCCGDTFGLAAINITRTGFTVVVWRNDSQSGWGQELTAEWGAMAPLEATHADVNVDNADEDTHADVKEDLLRNEL